MKTGSSICLKSTLLLFLISFSLYAQNYDSVFTKEISPGIIHKRVVSLKDTIVANILRIDLRKGGYYVKAAKTSASLYGREKTTLTAKSNADSGADVIAAINADFFDLKTGEPQNNMIVDGEFVKALSVINNRTNRNKSIRSQFAFTYDNKPMIERFYFKGELILSPNVVYQVHRINSSADSNSIVLYNRLQGDSIPALPEAWNALNIELKPLKTNCDTMIFIALKISDKRENISVKDGAFVLSAYNLFSPSLKDKIHENDTLRIITKLLPDRYKLRSLVGGFPKIVSNGRNIGCDVDWIEGTGPGLSKIKHPRTGIGFNEDGSVLYFIVVDGRQSFSRGLSLEGFGELMIKEGISQGLNLDGGGSSTMMVNGKIVNSPSDKGGERTVGNCLLLVREKTNLACPK